jgi:hypothetical protein
MPAGIGSELRKEASRFGQNVQMLKRPVSMFWIINRLPDSVNLLNEALVTLGGILKNKIVVKNLFFGDEDKFTRWDSSEAKQSFEKSGGVTITLTELHERAVDKLFADNDNIMSFSSAAVAINATAKSPHGLTPSENMELVGWLQDNHKTFESLRPVLGI